MLSNLNRLLSISLIFFILLFSCSSNQESGDESASNPPITKIQQAAFDALNTLQVRTDEKNKLYSTFPNIEHSCFPPDTSFMISQSELLFVLRQFGKKYFTKLNDQNRADFINDAVKAQSEYKVLFCSENSTEFDYKKGIPMIGIWIMPGVLNRRDIILVW